LIESLPRAERIQALRRIARNVDDLDTLFADWTYWMARDEQLPPDEWAEEKSKIVWLLLAGRGFGKTRTGAETVKAEILAGRAKRIALVAPTAADVRNVMVEGESGILGTATPDFRPLYEPSKGKLTWPNGSVALCYSADEPERLRGPQHDFAWCDELAAWRYSAAWDMLMLGLRLGARPRAVVTTTPKPTRLIRDLAASPTTVLTRGSTFANRDNLAPAFLSVIVQTYEGTRLGRQELYAELLEQADGALWTRAMLDTARIDIAALPEMKRIVVAIDPAVSAGEKSDETGMIVAGLGADGLVYVLADASGRFSPDEWARRAISLYDKHGADRIIGETNNGGDLIETTLRTVRPAVPYKAVTATKGKRIRAEPVAALYEQNRVRHAPGLGLLEDQMCNWEPGGADRSPDRLDALVWAVTELMFTERTTGLLDYYGSFAAKDD
jgi:phage terminase large subunit-like protein